jgi:tetratricopeptide (TPR) repeat protein
LTVWIRFTNELQVERITVIRQRDRAEKNFALAVQTVDDYLTTISESTLLQSRLPGLQPLRKDLLTTALRYYQTFVDQHHDEPTLQAELAKAYYRVGQIKREMGEQTEALQAVENSRDLWEKLLGDHPTDVGVQTGLANTYLEIGLNRIRGFRQPVESLQILEQARVLYERLTSQFPEDPLFQNGLARCYTFISASHGITDQESEQLHCLEKTISIRESLAKNNAKYRADLGSAYVNIGFAHAKHDRPAKALRYYLKGLAIIETLARDKPYDSVLQGELSRTYMNVGFAYDKMRQYQEALKFYDKSLSVSEEVARANPSVVEFQIGRAGAYYQVGYVQFRFAQFEKAAACAQKAIESTEEALRTDPTSTRPQSVRAEAYNLFGKAKGAVNEHAAALKAFQQCLAIQQEMPGSNTSENDRQYSISECWNCIANEQSEVGRYEESVRSHNTSIKILEKLPGKQADLAQAYVDLGMVYLTAGQQDEAEPLFRNAREILEKLPELRPSALFNLASARALSSHLIGLGKPSLTPGEEAERTRLANHAMDALQDAVATGYMDIARLKQDRRLDVLRTRADFQELVGGLVDRKKSDPK